MPSFDIVNKVDLSEVDNAVNNVLREVATRYDFRNSNTTVQIDKKEKVIHIVTSDSMKITALEEMIQKNCVRRKVDPRCLEFKKSEPSGAALKGEVKIKEGVSQDIGREIVKAVKELNLKVQASIQDDQVRVTGKKIDDLQTVIQSLNSKDFRIPLQYVNMKS